MGTEEIANTMARLREPFSESEIEWRVQRSGVGNRGPWAFVLAYVTNRAIMNRLDDIFGIGGWRNEFVKWGEVSTLCGISCLINGEWITKWDGASETEIEATKGGLSDSMKRAAVQWGIGRYLYNLEANYAECSTERQTGKEWRYAKTKDGVFYWRPPMLPDEALPENERGRQRAPSQQPKSAGNAPQSAETGKPYSNTGSGNKMSLSLEERRKAMISYALEKFDVSRGMIRDAVGLDPETFNEDEINAVKEALRIMAQKNVDFQSAYNHVKQ